METDREIIFLDGHEAQVIVDKLRQTDTADRELLLNVGGIYVELAGQEGVEWDINKTSAISLSDTQLWMLKECIRTSDSVGPDKLGRRLVTKIFQGLLNLRNRNGIPGDIPGGEEKGSDDYDKSKIAEWRSTIANEGDSNDTSGSEPVAPA